MELRPVRISSEDDVLQVMTWRNDPDARRASHHTEPMVWPAYQAEFLKNYSGVAPAPVFILVDGERVGFMGFRRYPDWQRQTAVSLDILLAPERRGKGLGGEALRQVPVLAAGSAVAAVIAEVREDNAASIKTFDGSPLRFRDTVVKTVPGGSASYRVLRYVWEMN